MGKILIGVATAALWFALSHVANAEQMGRQISGPGVDVHVSAVGMNIGH